MRSDLLKYGEAARCVNTTRPLTPTLPTQELRLTVNSIRTCSIDGCDKKHYGHGWCHMHYQRWYQHGDPQTVLLISKSESPVCSIDGCDGPYLARGFCKKHYRRWQEHGDPQTTVVRPPGATLLEAFRFVMPEEAPGPESCWIWRGGFFTDGYGQIKFAGKPRKAHRLAYALFNGPIRGAVVRHSCDTPACVNPAHLLVGTTADNNRDRAERRRSHRPAGELNAQARLTADQVSEIRSRYASGGISQRALAAEYGIEQTTVSAIIRHKAWRHLP